MISWQTAYKGINYSHGYPYLTRDLVHLQHAVQKDSLNDLQQKLLQMHTTHALDKVLSHPQHYAWYIRMIIKGTMCSQGGLSMAAIVDQWESYMAATLKLGAGTNFGRYWSDIIHFLTKITDCLMSNFGFSFGWTKCPGKCNILLISICNKFRYNL